MLFLTLSTFSKIILSILKYTITVQHSAGGSSGWLSLASRDICGLLMFLILMFMEFNHGPSFCSRFMRNKFPAPLGGRGGPPAFLTSWL